MFLNTRSIGDCGDCSICTYSEGIPRNPRECAHKEVEAGLDRLGVQKRRSAIDTLAVESISLQLARFRYLRIDSGDRRLVDVIRAGTDSNVKYVKIRRISGGIMKTGRAQWSLIAIERLQRKESHNPEFAPETTV